jgi:hypothetical protein
MMLAWLRDEKGQTRRVFVPQPPDHLADITPSLVGGEWLWLDGDGNRFAAKAPFVVGEHRAVTEAFRVDARCPGLSYDEAHVVYACDGATEWRKVPASHWDKPAAQVRTANLAARYMPVWASRSTALVVDARAEQVQEISLADAEAETGEPMHRSDCRILYSAAYDSEGVCVDPERCSCGDYSAIEDFELLWDTVNGHRYPFASDPWVAVGGLRRLTT